MASKLVLGCGYLGRRVADAWASEGHDVHVVTRSAERAAAFAADGFNPIVADLTREIPELPAVDSVLFAVSWDRHSGATPHEVYVGGLKRTMAALTRSDRFPSTFLFVSTTGVYGDGEGIDVDESTPCRPTRDSGRAYVEAEALLRESPLGASSIVLRLAGIYGPGRIPLLGELRQGEPLAVREDAWLNLIHVEDAVVTILACERLATPPALFCLSDGTPVRRGDWYRAVAQAFGLPAPRFAPPVEDGSRRGGDKRIRSEKLFREIGPKLRHPTYLAGLAAEVARAS